MAFRDNLVNRLRLKVAFLLVARKFLHYLTVLAFLFGLVIVIVRVSISIPRLYLLWGLWCIFPILIFAVYQGVHQTPSRGQFCALFDAKNNSGGLLMADEEFNLGAWHQRLVSVSQPDLKWHSSRSVGLFSLALVFVVVSFLLPQRYVNISSARTLDISEDVEELHLKIETLKEESIISEQVADEFVQQLEQLEDSSSVYEPAKTWEALDHLEQTLEKNAQEFASSAVRQTEAVTQTQTLAEGLYNDGAALDDNLLAEAMSELFAMLQSHTENNEMLKNALSSEVMNACQAGILSPEQLKQLLEELKNNKAALSGCLGRLCQAGLIDQKLLKLCEKLGLCDSSALIAFLNENASKMGFSGALSMYCQTPGRGGISRGRGDAPLTWMEPSSEEGIRFKEEVLPPASLNALKDSRQLGISVGVPQIEKEGGSQVLDVLSTSKRGEGQTIIQTVLPRHRSAVKHYFEREAEKQ